MASVTSNSEAVRRGLSALSQALNPRRVTADGQTFGVRLVKTAAKTIRERTADRQEAPSGEPLAPLKPSTKKKKRRAGLDPRILIAHDDMLHAGQLEGENHVGRNEVVMTYGTDEAEKKKAEYAHEGQAGVREKRPFYELGPDGEAAVDAEIRAVLGEAARGGN